MPSLRFCLNDRRRFLHIGAPFVGTKVARGDKLFTMEAMKMQTTIYAAADGVVAEINVTVSENVESKDLLAKLRA
jgi:pyruvate carboxylase